MSIRLWVTLVALAACSAPTPDPSAQSTPPPTSGASQPAVGPTGRIAFQADLANDTSGIYVMDADGSNLAPVIDAPGVHELDPVWSPDGRFIAYSTLDAGGSLRGSVFIIDPGGGEPVLVEGAYAYAPPTWSPDGSMLALGGDGAERGISVYDVEAAELTRLTEDGGTAAHWSPDGSRIAYGAAGDVHVVDVASGESIALTTDRWNDAIGRWADDGDRIIFVSDRDTDQSADSGRSWVVDADGGEPELLGEPLRAFAHWPSPDGRWLAYAADDGLRLAKTDGSDDRLVFPTIPADQGPSWAPDGRAFVFSTASESPRDLFIMRVDADSPVQLTSDAADESAPNWGPAGG